MKTFYTPFTAIAVILSCQFSFAQSCPPGGMPDSGNSCSAAPILCVSLDGYCNTLNNNHAPQAFPGCPPPASLDNDEWIAFYAGSTHITIEVTPSNCTVNGSNPGLQAGIYHGCPGAMMDVQCSCTENPFELESTNYIIGDIYWLVLDGCGGDLCDYTIAVTEGSTGIEPLQDPGDISGPDRVCAETNTYSVPVVPGATSYTWSLTPSGMGALSGGNNEDVDVTWQTNASGQAELCLVVANDCYLTNDTVCKTITVVPEPTAVISGFGKICPGGWDSYDLTVTFTGTGPWVFTPVVAGNPQPPIETSDNPYTLTVFQSGMWHIQDVHPVGLTCSGLESGWSFIKTAWIEITHTVENATCGESNGSIHVIPLGDFNPFSYLWSNGETLNNLDDVLAGTYTITITNSRGCTLSSSITVGDDPRNYTLGGESYPNTACNTNFTGSINLTVSPMGNHTYLWDNGASTQDLNNLAPGTYDVTVTSGLSCTATASFVVGDQPNPPDATYSITESTCNLANGSINLTVTGGAAAYTYLWSNGATAQDPANVLAGDYSVTVTGANGCTDVTEATLTNNNPLINISGFIIDNTHCNDLGNGSINAFVFPAGSFYTYLWSNGASSSSIYNLLPGDYSLTVTGLGTCSNIANYVIGDHSNLPTLAPSYINPTCGLNNGNINLSVSGAEPPFTYLWSNGDTTDTLNSLPAAVYAVTVTGSNGCSTIEVVVLNNKLDTVSIGGLVHAGISCVTNTGSVTLSVMPGNAAILWDNGSADLVRDSLPPGAYSVTVSAGGTCFGTASFLVPDSTVHPVIASAITPAICINPNGSIDLSVSGAQAPYTFNWSNASSSEDLTGLLPGIYSVTVTGADGCTADSVLFVPSNSSSFSLAGVTQPLSNCTAANGAIDLNVTPTGSYTYLWSIGASTQDIANLPAGIYTVSVTDPGVCTALISFIIPDDRSYPATAQGIAAEICNLQNGSVDLTVSSGAFPYSYVWSGGQTTQDLSNIPSGLYTVTVTGANHCTATASIDIPDNNFLFAVAAALADNTSCISNNGAINVSVNPAVPGLGLSYSYLWSNNSSSEDLSNLAPGNYEVTVSAGGSCTATAIFIIVNDTPTPVIGEVVSAEFCGQSNGFVDLNVNGGQSPYTYNWSNNQVSEDITGLPAGNYSVTVTGGNACSTVGTYNISEIVIIPSIIGTTTTNTSCTANDGGIVLNVTPSLPYTYHWGGGQTNTNLQNIPGGNYSVTVSAGGSCFSEASFNVPSDVAVVSLTGSTTNVLCFGDASGNIDLTVNGATAPVLFNWLPAAGNIEDLSNLSAGTYAVTVTDVNGCSSSTLFTLTQPANGLQIACNHIADLSSPTALDGAGSVDISGGTAPYNVLWSPGGTQGNVVPGVFNFTNLDQGNYLVTVRDANGCPAQCGFYVGVVSCPTTLGTMGNSLMSLCGTSCITADYSTVGQFLDPNDALQFVLHKGSSNQIVNEIARSNQPTFCFDQVSMDYDTTYYISAIAGNADPAGNVIVGAYCMVISAPTPVVFYEQPVAKINPPVQMNCAIREIDLIGSSSLSGATFEWSTVGGILMGNVHQAIVKAGKAAPYSLVINRNGCKDTADVVVTDISNHPEAIIVATPDDLLDCVIDQIILAGTAEGTLNANTVWISGSNVYTTGTILQIEDPGTYQFVILDTLTQCSDTAIIIINENLAYPPLFLNPPGLLTCYNPSVTLTGGSPMQGIQFKWVTIAGVDTTQIGVGPTLAVTAPGTYWLIGIDPVNHCTNATNAIVNTNQVHPVADAGAGFTIKCSGETANLDGTGSNSNGALNFSWSTNNGNLTSGANTSTPLISKPGTYLLVVTDPANGCTNSDDVIIDPIEPTATATVNQPSCFGEKGSILIDEVIGAQPPLKFSLNNGPFTTESSFLNLEAGPYTIVVMDAEGCSTTLSAVLVEPAEIQIVVSPNATIDLGGFYQIATEINLLISQIQSVQWTPSTGLSCDTCLILIASPFVSTQYKVVVTTHVGCRDDATLRVLVDQEVDVYIPNIFSPNDDGENDVFTVFADLKGVAQINFLQVYNRWGELLWEREHFQPNDLSLGWDGTCRGKEMNPAVFVYQAMIEFIDGRKELFKGDVTLKR